MAETQSGPASSSTRAGTLPAGTQPTDVLLAYAAWDQASGTLSSAPAGWNLIRQDTSNPSGLGVGYWWAPGSVAALTWTYSGAITNGLIITGYRGVSNSSPIAAQNGQFANTNTPASPAITVPTGGWFWAAAGCYNLSASFSTPAGLTSRGVAQNMQVWDSAAPDPGSISATTTISPSNGGWGTMEGVALRPGP